MACRLFVGVLVLRYLVFVATSTSTPFLLNTSAGTYGPDGPWQAVTIALGSGDNVQQVDVFPGGLMGSFIMTKQTCSGGLRCVAGGVYDPALSSTFYNTSLTNVYVGQSYSLGALSLTTTIGVATDTLGLGGPASNGENPLQLRNFSISVVPDFDLRFPTGAGYPLQAGQLSLGPFTNYSFSSSGNESLVPGALSAQGSIPSSSYGLHIGSPSLNSSLPLSLWLGGYDQQRLIGEVSTQPPDGHQQFQIDLLDIGIAVDSGASPFLFDSKEGLLASGNETITTHVPVYMNAEAPYLYLPNSTCVAITQNLPVTYNTKYGLYLWNTTSPDYTRIITSPSYLSFTFRNSINSITNFTINVPFQLLNLTLDTSLVTIPTQYFPCQDPHLDGRYSLGRAFLQAAFLGANWDNNEWYLAQAPGPNIASQPSMVPYLGIPISSSNKWSDTWKGSWTPLADTADKVPSETAIPDAGGGGGLSKGAIAGIVIGVVAVLIVAIGGALMLLRRRKRNQRQPIYPAQPDTMTKEDNPGLYGALAKPEMGEDGLHEMPCPEHRAELFDMRNSGGHELDAS